MARRAHGKRPADDMLYDESAGPDERWSMPLVPKSARVEVHRGKAAHIKSFYPSGSESEEAQPPLDWASCKW